MFRVTLMYCLCGVFTTGAELPELSLTSGKWTCTDGAEIDKGVATLKGDPAGYTRVTTTLPGTVLAGKTIRFSARVKTRDLTPGKTIAYASPKLKMIDIARESVMGVNNFGHGEINEWKNVELRTNVPTDINGPITLELGLQLCSGILMFKDVKIAAVKPWRWRVLDAGHKSYFDK